MKSKRRQRLLMVIGLVGLAGAVTALVVNAIKENRQFFFSPSQLAAKEAPFNQTFRLGGLVEKGSVERKEGRLEVAFSLTDQANTARVIYSGILPDLFREGQGIIAIGQLEEGGVFRAAEVLAKHDENYMPPEIAESLVETLDTPK